MVSRPSISLVCHGGLQQEDQVKLSPRENNQQAASTESQLIEEFWLSPEISRPLPLKKSWSVAMVQHEFQVSNYMARQAEALVTEK